MTVRVTWWGHATATIELGGVRVLTDPLLTPRLAHLRRVGSPVPPVSARTADAVLVSHLHLDHLHVPSLRLLAGAQTLLVPRGAGHLIGSRRCARGADVRELEVGDEHRVGALSVRAVHAHHDGRRLPGSRVHGPALGYLLEHAGVRVWFAGDTGPFDAMAQLGPVDVAVVPVGGWGPMLGPEHLDPEQAAAACALVRARHAVPIHYGTFWPVGLRLVAPGLSERMFRSPGERFAAAVAVGGGGTAVHVLRSGETARIDG